MTIVIRPWTDPVAVASRGRTTTFKDGSVRPWTDFVAINSQGRRTSYMPGEEPTISMTGQANNMIEITGQANNTIEITGQVEE